MEATEKGQATYPFCSNFMDGSSRTFCTSDKKSVGSCNMVKFSRRVPKIYRNFNEVDGVKSSDLNYASLNFQILQKLIIFTSCEATQVNGSLTKIKSGIVRRGEDKISTLGNSCKCEERKGGGSILGNFCEQCHFNLR